MASVSAGHIILTPNQPVGGGRPQPGSNPGLPYQESCALPIELLHLREREKREREKGREKREKTEKRGNEREREKREKERERR